MKTKTIDQKANEIIKLFIDNDIHLSMQLEILKIVRQKIEFCRNAGKEVNQQKLKTLKIVRQKIQK